MSTMLARNLSQRLTTISRTFASQAKLVESTRNEKTGKFDESTLKILSKKEKCPN